MNFNQFTIKAQEVVQKAQSVAMEYEHQHIETAHILEAIFKVDEHVTPYLLKKTGADITAIKRALERLIKREVSNIYPGMHRKLYKNHLLF